MNTSFDDMQAEANHSHFQRDFVSLNMETVAASDAPILFLRTNDHHDDVRTEETCVCDSVMTEVPSDDASLAKPLALSISTDSQMAWCTTQEPVRLLRPGSNQKPKRFYRTFWRGLSKRIILNDKEHY